MSLHRDEDVDLRRLAVFAKFGMLTGDTIDRYEELLERDRRAAIREVTDIVTVFPGRTVPGVVREWGA